MLRLLATISLVALPQTLAGCAREPLPEICPDVAVGELVIAELRGDQDGQDSYGHWIEIHNAGSASVDLTGMRVRFRGASGEVVEFLIRSEVELAAGAEVAVGPGLPDEPAAWLDYAIGWDMSGGDPTMDVYPRDLLREASGFLELEACGELIDSVYFDALPLLGTLACGSADEQPDSEANDDASLPGCWCVDAADADPGQPLFGVGQPGTPGEPNRCP